MTCVLVVLLGVYLYHVTCLTNRSQVDWGVNQGSLERTWTTYYNILVIVCWWHRPQHFLLGEFRQQLLLCCHYSFLIYVAVRCCAVLSSFVPVCAFFLNLIAVFVCFSSSAVLKSLQMAQLANVPLLHSWKCFNVRKSEECFKTSSVYILSCYCKKKKTPTKQGFSLTWNFGTLFLSDKSTLDYFSMQ